MSKLIKISFVMVLLSLAACNKPAEKADTAKASVSVAAAAQTADKAEEPKAEEPKEDANILTDQRDGQKYKTVKIGGETWMAENMRYAGVDHYSADGNNNNDNKYGYLYKWEMALKVCPTGWHLPSKTVFEGLLSVAATNSNSAKPNPALLALVAKDSVWEHNYKDRVTGSTAFDALPAGTYDDGDYYGLGSRASFWSATEFNNNYAFRLTIGNGYVDLNNYSKIAAFSVRCVKD